MSLRYHAFPYDAAMAATPRYEAADAAGRRLSTNGALSGALHSLGYYSTEVCLGTPGRSYDLIVDTGSSITAVPCSTCKQCGTHHCGAAGRYDVGASASATPVSCRAPPQGTSCENCGPAGTCTYSVHYTEGSAIRGHIVGDLAHLTQRVGSANVPLSMRAYFGCQTLETGMFYRQQADGIMGMQPPRSRARVPSMLSSLVTQQRAADVFSLCFSDTAGLFLVGGTPNRNAMAQRRALTLSMERGARARYTLKMTDVRVSGGGAANTSFASLNLPLSTYAPTLVDSGTTFVYASTPLFRALHAHIKRHLPALERKQGGKMCTYLDDARLDAMPSLQFVFADAPAQPLLIRPKQYMVHFPERSAKASASAALAKAGAVFGGGGQPAVVGKLLHYCVAVFDNQRGGTVIGASIMRNREVVFDIASNRISFVDADCSTITPQTSNLNGAYAFAPCPGKKNSTPPASGGRGGFTSAARAAKSAAAGAAAGSLAGGRGGKGKGVGRRTRGGSGSGSGAGSGSGGGGRGWLDWLSPASKAKPVEATAYS